MTEQLLNVKVGSRWDVVSHLVKTGGFKNVVELGLARGRMTFLVLQDCPEIEHYIGVDMFSPEGMEEYVRWGADTHQKNFLTCRGIAKLDPRFHLIVGDTASTAALFDGVDLVFIDADHREEGVIRDIEAWRPKIREGGILCGHDFNWESVRAA